jgi:hypothetical protein
MILFPSSSDKTHSLNCSTVSSSTHPSPSRSVVPTLQKKQKEKKTVFVRRCCGLSPDRLLWSNCELAKQTDRKDSSDGAPIVAWNSSKDARLTTRCKKKVVGPPPCNLMRALLPTEKCWKWLCMYFHNPFRPFALLCAHRERGPLLFFCLHPIFSAPSPHTPFVATYQGHCLM